MWRGRKEWRKKILENVRKKQKEKVSKKERKNRSKERRRIETKMTVSSLYFPETVEKL